MGGEGSSELDVQQAEMSLTSLPSTTTQQQQRRRSNIGCSCNEMMSSTSSSSTSSSSSPSSSIPAIDTTTTSTPPPPTTTTTSDVAVIPSSYSTVDVNNHQKNDDSNDDDDDDDDTKEIVVAPTGGGGGGGGRGCFDDGKIGDDNDDDSDDETNNTTIAEQKKHNGDDGLLLQQQQQQQQQPGTTTTTIYSFDINIHHDNEIMQKDDDDDDGQEEEEQQATQQQQQDDDFDDSDDDDDDEVHDDQLPSLTRDISDYEKEARNQPRHSLQAFEVIEATDDDEASSSLARLTTTTTTTSGSPASVHSAAATAAATTMNPSEMNAVTSNKQQQNPSKLELAPGVAVGVLVDIDVDETLSSSKNHDDHHRAMLPDDNKNKAASSSSSSLENSNTTTNTNNNNIMNMESIENQHNKVLERLMDGGHVATSTSTTTTTTNDVCCTSSQQPQQLQRTSYDALNPGPELQPGAIRMRGSQRPAFLSNSSSLYTTINNNNNGNNNNEVMMMDTTDRSSNVGSNRELIIEAYQVPEIGHATVINVEDQVQTMLEESLRQRESEQQEQQRRDEEHQRKEKKRKHRLRCSAMGFFVVVILSVVIVVVIVVQFGSSSGNNDTAAESVTFTNGSNNDSSSSSSTTIPKERTIQIIHSNEHESNFQDINTLEEKVLHYSSLVEGLRKLSKQAENIDASIHVLTGDLTIPGPFFHASSEIPKFNQQKGMGDITMLNAMKVDATALGNHEFDTGLSTFATLLSNSDFPYLSVNIDLSNAIVPNGIPPIVVGEDAMNCDDVAGQVVKSCILETTTSDSPVQIGLIGRSPSDLFHIIEGSHTVLPGATFVGGRNSTTGLANVDSSVLIREQVQLLESKGIDIIILLDQSFDDYNEIGEPIFEEELKGIDIVIGEVWENRIVLAQLDNFGPFNFLRDEDKPADVNYPVVRRDSSGNRVLFVSCVGYYRYVGNLIVTFDDNGVVASWDGRSGPIATTQEAVELMEDVVGGNLEPVPVVADTFKQLQSTPSIQDSFAVVGRTRYPLEGSRSEIRTRDTNLGRLVADSTLWASELYTEEHGLPPVDVALKNAGGIRASIVGPAITRFSIRTTLAFNNKLILVELTAGQLLAALENAVSAHPVHDGRFPQISGMRLEVNSTMPAIDGSPYTETPSRLRKVVILGHEDNLDASATVLVDNYKLQPIVANRTFVMATNSFLGSGGDQYTSIATGRIISETGIGEQQILEDYILSLRQRGGDYSSSTFEIDLRDPPPQPSRMVIYNSY